MNKLRAVQPSNNDDAARFRPVQPVNERVIRKCCQNNGSRLFGVFEIVSKSFLHWKRNNPKRNSRNRPLLFMKLPNQKFDEILENFVGNWCVFAEILDTIFFST